jgi:hypothetical protein
MKRALRIVVPAVAIIMIGILLYVSCGKDKATSSGPSTEWTIMVYSDGNNNLDNAQGGGSYCVQDIQDLENVGSTDKVQIVAMVASLRTGGGAKYYHIEHFPNDLGDNISSTMLVDKGSKAMCDWQTLKEFLEYGFDNYPAKKYMLIVDDHGAGWPGSCSDEQNGSGRIMAMYEMANAIEQALAAKSVAKFEVVTFHACLMSQVEVGYELRNAANYLVASEFSMPMESVLGSDIWLTSLTANPTTGARDLASNIASAVYQTGISKQKIVHMAATDLSQIGQLAAKIDNLGTQLSTSTGNHWDDLLEAWLSTHTTNYDNPAYVDLKELTNQIRNQPDLAAINLINNAALDVNQAITDAVVYTGTNAVNVPRGGLTIHMPYLRDMYDSTNYARIDFQAVPWTNFLSRFIGLIEEIINHSLTVTVNPANSGTVAADPDQTTFQQGEQVTLTATPNANYSFVNWTVNGTDYDGNPIQITFAGDDVEVVAHFTQGGGQNVTINGSLTWQGHNLSYPILALIDQGTIVKFWRLTGGAQTAPFSVQFTTAEATSSWIYGFDDLNNNNILQETGEPWNCYDGNGDQYCDLFNYTPGQTINGINIILYVGATASHPDNPTPLPVVNPTRIQMK